MRSNQVAAANPLPSVKLRDAERDLPGLLRSGHLDRVCLNPALVSDMHFKVRQIVAQIKLDHPVPVGELPLS